MTVRVIQWGTGNVGRHSLREILERPDLELVGLRVFDPAKVGVDAGVMLGGDPVGVVATDDPDEIDALDADVVLFNSYGTTLVDLTQPVDDIARLLASGKNVISSAIDLMIYVKPGLAENVVTPKMVEKVKNACQAGSSTLYSTGMTPGFALDLWPITMTRVCRKVDRLQVTEIIDMRAYSSDMMALMGFGLAPDAEVEMFKLFEDTPSQPYAGVLNMVADALGTQIQEIRYERETAVTPELLVTAGGSYEAGTVAVIRFSFTGICDGVPLVTYRIVWWLSEDVKPEWGLGHCRWELEIDGDPSIRSAMDFDTQTDAKRPTSITVASACVNSIPAVMAAAPGLVNHLTLPVFGGRASTTLVPPPGA